MRKYRMLSDINVRGRRGLPRSRRAEFGHQVPPKEMSINFKEGM